MREGNHKMCINWASRMLAPDAELVSDHQTSSEGSLSPTAKDLFEYGNCPRHITAEVRPSTKTVGLKEKEMSKRFFPIAAFIVLALALHGAGRHHKQPCCVVSAGRRTSTADSSGNNNSLTFTGSPSSTSGKIGGGLNLDGTDDRGQSTAANYSASRLPLGSSSTLTRATVG